jgi:hypothetical protein
MGPLDQLKADVAALGDKASTEAKGYVADHQKAVSAAAKDLKAAQASERTR